MGTFPMQKTFKTTENTKKFQVWFISLKNNNKLFICLCEKWLRLLINSENDLFVVYAMDTVDILKKYNFEIGCLKDAYCGIQFILFGPMLQTTKFKLTSSPFLLYSVVIILYGCIKTLSNTPNL